MLVPICKMSSEGAKTVVWEFTKNTDQWFSHIMGIKYYNISFAFNATYTVQIVETCKSSKQLKPIKLK